ncbi:MAG: hypothetical protein ACI9QC_000338 [Oceanicoccus sp.]|jgi:hypothetical protein
MPPSENFESTEALPSERNAIDARLDRSEFQQVIEKQRALTEKLNQKYPSFSTLLESYLKTEVSDMERIQTMNRFELLFDKMLASKNDKSFQEALGLGHSSLRNDALVPKAHEELMSGDQIRLVALYSIIRSEGRDPALIRTCERELTNTELPALLDTFETLFQ